MDTLNLDFIRKIQRPKIPIVFLDLETTSTNPRTARIVEMCFHKLWPDGKQETKTYRVNPETPIPAGASEVHGIYDSDVVGKPKFRQYSKSLRAWIAGCDLVGYNLLRFDIPVLVAEFDRANTLHPFDSCFIIDVFKIFCHLNPRNLSACYKQYTGKELKGAHGADVDTLATAEILNTMVYQLDDDAAAYGVEEEISIDYLRKMGHDDNTVDWFGKFKKNDEGQVVFNFGKYKDEPVKHIFKTDFYYIEWLLNDSDVLPNDTKLKLREECGL